MGNALGDFLRSARLASAEVGRPGVSDRWRRQAVAMRAGISTSYYAQLEQGRRASPSPRVVDALARALELDEDAHRRLRGLAGCDAEAGPLVLRRNAGIASSIARAADALEHLPVAVLNPSLGVVRSNPRWKGLHAGFAEQQDWGAMVCLDPAAGAFYLDWHQVASHVLTRLDVAARREGDLDASRRVAEIVQASPSSRDLWERARRRELADGTRRSTRLRVRHPALGRIDLRHDVYRAEASGRADLHVLHPADEASRVLVGLVDLYAPVK